MSKARRVGPKGRRPVGDYSNVTHAVVPYRGQGWYASVYAALDSLSKAGASNVVCGYTTVDQSFDGDFDEQPPADTPLVWWIEADNARGLRSRGEAEPSTDHAQAILEACAQIMRGQGQRVVVVEGR